MSIVLEQLTKRFQGQPVVNNLSLEVGDGELCVLLGPSGSGKSTVLRLIAGLAGADAGRIFLHGREVTNVEPKQREVGFVFQHYALFRSMSVAENIEFALSIRKAPASERRQRRDELLELVGLAGLGGRMPRQLSGGQQQRVALARALAHRPQVLLLDEPFGALDARIRTELRRTVRSIQQELKITALFVTHDQEEAFELADRVALMNFGRLLEYGRPEELYLRPQTEFSAAFLGTANLMVGECTARSVRLGTLELPLATEGEAPADPRRVLVLFRPEDVELAAHESDLTCPVLGRGAVEEASFLGSLERLRLRLPLLSGVRPIAPQVPFGGDFMWVDASRPQHQSRRFPLAAGNAAWVGVRRVHALIHPGLSLLLSTDGSAPARAAVGLAAQIARLSHARVTVLGQGRGLEAVERNLQETKEQLGSGLAALEVRAAVGTPAEAVAEEAERSEHDLLVVGLPKEDGADLTEQMLQSGDHHLLLVPGATPPPGLPTKVLICVAVGEPGKEDVLFAGRLVRHLGAQATVLKVLTGKEDETQMQRFLAASVRTLERLGVPAEARLRRGAVVEEIQAELAGGDYGLLVVGSPLATGPAGASSRVPLHGVVQRLVAGASRPLLIVRSRRKAA